MKCYAIVSLIICSICSSQVQVNMYYGEEYLLAFCTVSDLQNVIFKSTLQISTKQVFHFARQLDTFPLTKMNSCESCETEANVESQLVLPVCQRGLSVYWLLPESQAVQLTLREWKSLSCLVASEDKWMLLCLSSVPRVCSYTYIHILLNEREAQAGFPQLV